MAVRTVYLSYPLSRSRRYYGGNLIGMETLIKQNSERYSRETLFQMNSHSGTHIDFPCHSYAEARQGSDYPPGHFTFRNSALVAHDLLSEDRPVDASLFGDVPDEVELLLLKTGYCRIRDEERYWRDSPVVKATLADDLRRRFPLLRMFGFDFISLTSQKDKHEGRKAHLRFLDDAGGRAILPIEDMDLRNVDSDAVLLEVIVAPLLYEAMDGAPCTVIAVVR